ncbi:protein kinase, putative [Trypanosoma brucei brucei TREU927]|uniref:Serine/threonine-protein kinase PLK n=1 Tax=Trypanosoma brucei brucei (strain 927/4 GUTat10.1) TaxID=185431 RepID=Q38DT1_TRYB2|nr:protein kinase, putative [Trypanosoma brucei brucei TREU927]EAN77039.1 protein kinase, putative [Trypanosoma brucei brucei TREU927]
MIGTVEQILYEEGCVRAVRVRLPSRDSSQGKCLSLEACERIGQGSFGTVYRASCDEYPRLALKITTGKVTRLKQELEVLGRVCTKGKLLLPRFLFGALNKSGDLMAVGMELCFPHTLHDFLLSKCLTDEADKLFVAYQVVQAVAYVHEQHCIHRDVKLQNFVFDLDGNLKLIDFGLATSVWNPPPGDVVAGTIAFMAPEMAHNALHRDQRVSVGAAADVWSVGMVLFSIFAQRNPYASTGAPRMTERTADTNMHNTAAIPTDASPNDKQSHEIPKENAELLRRVAAAEWSWPSGCSVSRKLRGLVDFVLVPDPQNRPDINALLMRPEWGDRRRATPRVVTTFLGVEDDFLLSHDESHLLRAVEQRSADVNASLTESRIRGSDEEETEEGHRSSLKFVAREELSVGGVPIHQVYDVRPDPKVKKPIREISSVIAEETERSLKRSRSRSARAAASSASRANSRVNARSRTVTPVPCTTEGRGNADFPTGSAAASLVLLEAEGKEETKTGLNIGQRSPQGRQPRSNNVDRAKGINLVGKRDPKPKSANGTVQRSTSPIEHTVDTKRGGGNNSHGVGARRGSTVTARKKKGNGAEVVSGFVTMENAVRNVKTSLLLLEHSCMVTRLSTVVTELFDREHMVWLEKEQRKSATHPHTFREMGRANKKYRYGFVCDVCCFEFEPVGSSMYFFHCQCGRDMCPKCYEEYANNYTCDACGREFASSGALRRHSCSCVKRLNDAATVNKPRGRSQGRRSRSVPTEAARTGVKSRLEVKPVSPKRGRPKRRASVPALERKRSREPAAEVVGIVARRKAERLSMSKSEVVPPPRRFEGIPRTLSGEWKPMERLSVGSRSVPPTPEERHMLLNGDWIRYYHFYPMEEEGGDSVAVTYHIQPGRTGVTFFNHSFSVHSAVLSVLEHIVYVVDRVDIEEDNDVARILSLAQALNEEKKIYDVLQLVETHDTHMLKQRRSPGIMSVYCPPQTAFQCNGDPFVFVRWYRFHMENSMSGFMLSNGAVQVFVGGKYELRWLDDNRKFIVRSNGVCEVLDEEKFPLSEELNQMLYGGV